jgi:hypothetical protein
VPLPSLPGGTQGDPQIRALPDGRAAVIHARVSPADGATGMVNTVVSWLEQWPPTFNFLSEMDPARGWSFAVDRGSAPYFALLAGTSAAPPGISYAFADATSAYFPSLETSAAASRALSVRAGSYRYLVGMEEPGPFLGGASYHLLAGWVHQPPNGIQYEGPFVFGCSDRPAKLDGIETGEGWLVAQPVPPGGCLDDVGPAAPTALTVIRVANDGMWYFGLSVPVSSPITDLFVAPRSSGGWIAYGLEQSASEPPRIEAVRMDDLGLLSYGPVSITPPGSVPFEFDAAAFGESGLVAAFVDDPANNPPDLTVEIVGDDGSLTTAHLEDAGFLGELHVLGNAGEGSILVAFGRPTPDGGSAVHLARFDCQP